MAGRTVSPSRRCVGEIRRLILTVVLFIVGTTSAGTQCLSQSGKPVDWFIIYKLPHDILPKDDSFYYMDADQPSWQLSPTTLKDTHGQAVFYTLQQIYETPAKLNGKKDVLKWRSSRFLWEEKELLYAMYNDALPENPKFHTEKLKRRFYEKTGHTKGVIGFDADTGFWLIQSTPKFPMRQATGYQWPSNGNVYAQSFLCISMATNQNLNEIGKQFQYNYPHFYDKSNQTALLEKYPMMNEALAGVHVESPPWNRTTILTSLAGKKFYSYAKSTDFNADLYSTWIAPTLQNNLLVETWQNGRNKLCSNCTGTYKVYNVDTLLFPEKRASFTETKDHAKWAVTNTTETGAWTCIGDINRQESQMKRGGGTVCMNDIHIWSAFRTLISTYHDCGTYKKCVEV